MRKNCFKAICALGAAIMLESVAAGCGFFSSEKDEALEEALDEEIVEKDVSTSYIAKDQKISNRIIMSDIADQSSDHIMELFSENTVNEVGEDKLREGVTEIVEGITGDIVKYEMEPDGGSGVRGGRGVTSKNYTVRIFTDKKIYHMCLYYVTRDTSSKDDSVNRANEGLHRIFVYSVSAYYGEEGISKLNEDDPYEAYWQNEGAFYLDSDVLASEVKYEGKSYTGYSIEYLQATGYDLAEKARCEAFMDALDEAGFQGDIVDKKWLTYIIAKQEEKSLGEIVSGLIFDREDEPDEEENIFRKADAAGYDMILTDEAGNQFFLKLVKGMDYYNYVEKVSDIDLNVLYEAEDLPPIREE